jgi:hypothetical protein
LSYAEVVTVALQSVSVEHQYISTTGASISNGVIIGEDIVTEPGAFVDHSVAL